MIILRSIPGCSKSFDLLVERVEIVPFIVVREMGVGKNWKNLEKNLLTSGISPFTARVRLNLTEISMHAKYRSPINPLFLTISRVIGSLLSPSSMEYLKKKKKGKKEGKKIIIIIKKTKGCALGL